MPSYKAYLGSQSSQTTPVHLECHKRQDCIGKVHCLLHVERVLLSGSPGGCWPTSVAMAPPKVCPKFRHSIPSLGSDEHAPRDNGGQQFKRRILRIFICEGRRSERNAPLNKSSSCTR